MARMNIGIGIGTRVGTGFAVGLALLIAVGTVGIGGLSTVLDRQDSFNAAVRDAEIASVLEVELLHSRMNVSRFLQSVSQENKNRVDATLDRLRSRLQEAERSAKEPERRDRLGSAAAALDRYREAFDAIAGLETQRSKLAETVDRNGGSAERLLAALLEQAAMGGTVETSEITTYAMEAQRSVFTARLMLRRYQIYRDTRSADAVGIEAGKVEEALAGIDRAGSEARWARSTAGIRRQLAEMKSGFQEMRGHTEEIARLMGSRLEPDEAELTRVAEAVRTSADTERQAAAETAVSAANNAMSATAAFLVAGVVFSLAAAVLIGRSIRRPVLAMTRTMSRLADGDTTVVIPGLERRDEIGAMAHAVQVFKTNAIAAGRIDAERRAEHTEKERWAKAVERLLDSFRTAVAEVIGVTAASVDDLGSAAQSMASVVERTTNLATTSADTAAQTSRNVQSVASASTEISASLQEISRQVNRSSAVAAKAVEEAQDTNRTVGGLADMASRVGNVVVLINDIAAQTNLLALNATIEAARAGDAGRGFAVVAGEVKALAGQTASATDEIAGQVRAIQDASTSAVSAIQNIQRTIDAISEIATAIASAVDQQTAVMADIARNIDFAANGTQIVSDNIGQVHGATREADDAAGKVVKVADDLARQVAVLRGEVESFLTGIRSA